MKTLIFTPYPENLNTECLEDINPDYINSVKPDLFIEVDNGTPHNFDLIKKIDKSIKKVFYCWDGAFRNRPYFNYSELFDYTFTTDSFLVDEFRSPIVKWLPMACPDKMESELVEKKDGVLFFGSVDSPLLPEAFNPRKMLLNQLKTLHGFTILPHLGYSVDS